MKIQELNNEIFKKRADNKREQAKKTISECIKKGAGAYEIIDDEHIYTSKQRMFDYLKMSAWANNREKDKTFKVDVITKNKKSQIIVIVKDKGE